MNVQLIYAFNVFLAQNHPSIDHRKPFDRSQKFCFLTIRCSKNQLGMLVVCLCQLSMKHFAWRSNCDKTKKKLFCYWLHWLWKSFSLAVLNPIGYNVHAYINEQTSEHNQWELRLVKLPKPRVRWAEKCKRQHCLLFWSSKCESHTHILFKAFRSIHRNIWHHSRIMVYFRLFTVDSWTGQANTFRIHISFSERFLLYRRYVRYKRVFYFFGVT